MGRVFLILALISVHSFGGETCREYYQKKIDSRMGTPVLNNVHDYIYDRESRGAALGILNAFGALIGTQVIAARNSLSDIQYTGIFFGLALAPTIISLGVDAIRNPIKRGDYRKMIRLIDESEIFLGKRDGLNKFPRLKKLRRKLNRLARRRGLDSKLQLEAVASWVYKANQSTGLCFSYWFNRNDRLKHHSPSTLNQVKRHFKRLSDEKFHRHPLFQRQK